MTCRFLILEFRQLPVACSGTDVMEENTNKSMKSFNFNFVILKLQKKEYTLFY